MSKYGVISGPHFPVFSPNTGKYGPEIPRYLDAFHAVMGIVLMIFFFFLVVYYNEWIQGNRSTEHANLRCCEDQKDNNNALKGIRNMCHSNIAQKMKFSIKHFFSKCDQIHRKLRIWSHLLKNSLMENFIFCAV